MKLSKMQIISLKIMLLFTVAIMSTFIAEYLHSFFGDWFCEGSGTSTGECWGCFTKCNYADLGKHEPTWHWGYRHWLYLTMCIVLFIIQLVDIAEYAEKKS